MHSEGVFFISKHSISVAAQRNERASEHRNATVFLCVCRILSSSLPKTFSAALHRLWRSSSHNRSILGKNWSLPVRQIFHPGRPALPSCDSSRCRYNSQAPCHSCSSFVPWHIVPTHCFLLPYFCLSWKTCLFSLFIIFLILFLLNFWFFCLDSSRAGFFCCWEMRGAHIFSLLALSSSREGSGKLPPSPSGTHCPHSQWLTHGHLAFHIVSTISSPKWEGRSSAYPRSVLCPFQGLWMTTDGILKRSGWIMHFRFSSQSETLWVGNEKENFR